MGDRTYVNLYVPAELAEQARPIIKESDGDPYDEGEANHLYNFGFDQVNYGELQCLDDLQKAGIAYDSDWDAGGTYEKGSQTLRFTPEGEAIVLTTYASDEGVPLNMLLPVLDDHEQLKAVILEHQAVTVPLPWSNQAEYGKKYRTLQLINPAQTET